MAQVLVTGVSGYLGSVLASRLLAKQYRVRGTVRSLANEERVKPLREALPGIELVEADLLLEGSFDKAVEGCEYVFHTASPFILDEEIRDPQKDLVEPALKGTLNVLNAADKVGTVKRIILTSSVAAIAGKRPEGHVYTEDDWNMDSTIDNEPYRYSKRIAEQTAWEFVKGKPYDLVVINPTFIVGPPILARADATSIKRIREFLNGEGYEKGVRPVCLGAVDIRDVVDAHVAAMEKKEAFGRYLVSSDRGIRHLELASYLKESGEFEKYPTKERAPYTGFVPRFSNKKVQEQLGVPLHPVNQAVIDMAHAMIKLGIVSTP